MALILMVDDELDACLLMERILTALGHEVQVFTEGEKAIRWLHKNSPQLAILDIKMPRTDGLAVLECIRRIQPQTKVMLITCCPATQAFNKALELGIQEFLVKPIEIDELEERVHRVLITGR